MAALESFVFVFAASFSIGLSGAMSPGPLTVFVMGQSARYGVLAGPLAALGHGLLEFALVVLLWLGLARVLQWEPLLAAIGVVGGLVMIWMGWKLVSGVRRKGARLAASTYDRHADNPMVGGALLSLANPLLVVLVGYRGHFHNDNACVTARHTRSRRIHHRPRRQRFLLVYFGCHRLRYRETFHHGPRVPNGALPLRHCAGALWALLHLVRGYRAARPSLDPPRISACFSD